MDWLEFGAALVGSLAWPAVAVGIAIAFRGTIKTALDSTGDRLLKRVKAGPFEAEWEARVQQALVDVAESAEADPSPQAGGTTASTTLPERLSRLAEREPRAAVLAAYAEIEEVLRGYLALVGFTGTARPMTARQLARQARIRELISPEIADASPRASYSSWGCWRRSPRSEFGQRTLSPPDRSAYGSPRSSGAWSS